MLFPLAIAILGQQAAAPFDPAAMMTAPSVVEVSRLRVTPKIDGKIEAEEWDSFTTTAATQTYFEWEPAQLHFAATVANGQDLVVSLDLKHDGWLVGKDNIELRVSLTDGKPSAVARLLDATNVTGPTWRDLPELDLALKVAATSDAGTTTYEVSVTDPGTDLIAASENQKIGVRMDSVPTEVPALPAVMPRSLAVVALVNSRAAALPLGLKWNTEFGDIPIVPGESGRVRLTFKGKNDLKITRLEMRSEGFGRDATNLFALPFPSFDTKGRAYIDYSTRIAPDSLLGYRILRGTLTTADGVPSVLQTSYRIAPIVDVDVVHTAIPVSSTDRGYKLPFYITANSRSRVSGTVTIKMPEGFRVLNDSTKTFSIFGVRGKTRQIFEIYIPAGKSGTYAADFTLTVKDQILKQSVLFTIR